MQIEEAGRAEEVEGSQVVGGSQAAEPGQYHGLRQDLIPLGGGHQAGSLLSVQLHGVQEPQHQAVLQVL